MNALSPAARSELLAGYVLGDLSPAEQAMVEEYLSTHPTAQQELQDLQNTWMLLPLALPEVRPNEQLRDHIMQGAMEAVAATSVVENRRSHRQLKGLWVLLGLAVTGAIGGLGWQNYHLQQQMAAVQQQQQQLTQDLDRSRQQTALAQQEAQEQRTILSRADTRFLPVKAMGKSAASGTLLLAPVKTKAFLNLQKVPALPTGKVYRIWAVKANGESDCGHFLPDAQGVVSKELPLSDWDGAISIVITIEAEQAKEPEGPEVMEGEIKL
jgi:Anti-sigma-K factor rskA